MSNTLSDILANKSFREPREITIIKDFVQEHFRANVSVILQENQIIIVVAHAALAGSLRTHLYDLQKRCKTKRQLQIRIQS